MSADCGSTCFLPASPRAARNDMDSDIVVFWLVCSLCLAGLAATWARMRFTAPGWLVLLLAILLLSVAGWLWSQPAIIYTAAAIWLGLVLLPGLIGRLCQQRLMQQQYSAARRLARIISWLHPADGWREQPKLLGALELAHQGEFAAAVETLRRFQDAKSLIGLVAVANLYRITNQWEELLVWHARHRQELERHLQFVPVVLRARGETGDVRGLVEFYDGHRRQIAKLVPAASRDVCRLMLFAFCGQRQAVEGLLAGSLTILPAPIRIFWLATAEVAAGAPESAQRRLEELLPAADPPLRGAIERRLSRMGTRPEPLDASAEHVVAEAAQEHGHEARFGARRKLFSRQSRATQILILLNLCMFLAEICLGGSTNRDVLYRLGALFPPAVRGGQWWRLVTSLFLHCGALHLAMNMFALCVLGPFTEFALGCRRFVLVYALAGIGSMTVVMLFGSGPNGTQLTVGASGCIMGLVGAMGALMLRGWRREKALVAKRRLLTILLIVSLQCAFDALVPQVSMTAHVSGALIGFTAAMVLRDRLGRTATHGGQPTSAGAS